MIHSKLFRNLGEKIFLMAKLTYNIEIIIKKSAKKNFLHSSTI